MAFKRNPMRDPRTVARDIPGILNIIFPHLTGGLATYFNKKIISSTSISAIDELLIQNSQLKSAMLFELSFALAEQLFTTDNDLDWNLALDVAVERQRKHFDAKIPKQITNDDKKAAEAVARNLHQIIIELIPDTDTRTNLFVSAPKIPGFQWIASGNGDFAFGDTLIEVKCTDRNFISADYRQILIYWLLSFASKVNKDGNEWDRCILINPRRNVMLDIQFDEMIQTCSAGRSKIEILELFSSIVGDYALKSIREYRL